MNYDICVVGGDGDGLQYNQDTNGTEDIPVLEDASEDVIESDLVETNDGSLSGPSMLDRTGMFSGRRSVFPGLLLVCRQITDEIKPILYRSITLTVDKYAGEAHLASLFSLKTREHFRKVILVLYPDGLFYDADSYMDPKVWDSLFDNLSILGIVIEEPEPAHQYRVGRDGMNDEKEEWRPWLTTTLEYINQAILNDAKVVGDTNKMTDATQIVEKAMPGRCNFQNLPDGDLIFQRGEYSYTGGYWDNDDGPTSCSDIIDDCDYDYCYSD
ncbi:gpi ethanolamine phosphate transferase [Fusarium flagelliforme]|uniref:Gpi ethanolamine phosphate transferase n=1 Tax=Fusarium flagelliforme TaxID=2675880 RepID=A0A395MGK4_9HYPO|nr:gpi ethanolamine phosphate transferase [Fusarium flagelliforme]